MKYVLIVVVLAILGIGAWFVLGGPAVEPVVAPSGETVGEGTAPEAPATTGVDVNVSVGATTVTYTDAGFSPANTTIKVGDTVHFVNNSSGKMWVASDQHPTHTEYDGTTLMQHCASGASFDECKAVMTGGTYDFTFTKAGTWEYHNHSNASKTGTVVVQ